MFALEIENLKFSYQTNSDLFFLPKLQIKSGERVFIYGPSGCGKTTFLSLVSGLLKPLSGTINILGTELTRINVASQDKFRAQNMGIIFQQFNLIPYLSVLENIRLSDTFVKSENGDESWLKKLMQVLTIEQLQQRPVAKLSVGEQQRVALARALYRKPKLIIADEPTSSLDSDRRNAFLDLLFESCNEIGSTVLFVSHDRSLQDRFGSSLSLAKMTQSQEENVY